MEHPGVLKKWHAEFPSVDQKRSGISRGDKEYIVWNLQEWFNTILWEFPEVK